MQGKLAGSLRLLDKGKGAKVREADPNSLKLKSMGCGFACSVLLRYAIARVVEQIDPVRDEAAFPWRRFGKAVGQRGMNTAAHPVTHDHDLFDLQLRHREFQRGRYAVATASQFKRGDEICDISDDEYLAWRGIKYCGGISPAVRAGNHHNPG